MTEFMPDYSSEAALRKSIMDEAAALRKAAAESDTQAGMIAYTDAAEIMERRAEDMAKNDRTA